MLKTVEVTMPNPANASIYIFATCSWQWHYPLWFAAVYQMWKEHNPWVKQNVLLFLWKTISESKSPFPKQGWYRTRHDSTHTPSHWAGTALLHCLGTSSQTQTSTRTKNLWMILSEANLQKETLLPAFKKLYFLQSSQFVSNNIPLCVSSHMFFPVNIVTCFLGRLSS